MWKRITVTGLVLVLLLSGCGAETETSAGGSEASVRTASVTRDAVVTMEETVEDPAAEPVEQGGVVRLASQFEVTGLEDFITTFQDQNPAWTVEQEVLTQEELNLRLAAGDAPDLIDSSYDNVNVLCRKGFLTDLGQRLDGEPDMDPADFVHLELMERCGGLYQAPMGFAMEVVLALEEVYGVYDPWDFAAFTDAMAAADSPQAVAGNMTATGFVAQFLQGYCSEYVDYSNGTAQFDTEQFRRLLETARAIDLDADDPNVEGFSAQMPAVERFQQNPYALMVEYVSCIDSSIPLGSYKQLCATYGGLPVMYRGFPSENGGNGTILRFSGCVSLCTQAVEPEGAWAFVRFAMTDLDAQAEQEGFPIYRPALERQIETSKLAEEQAADLLELIDGAADASGYEGEVTGLVLEEAERYFAGQQDLDTTVASIQSRVTIYLAEQS